MGFAQIAISNVSAVKGSSSWKQIAEGGIRLFSDVRVVGSGKRRLVSFSVGSGCVTSTGLIASGLGLCDFSLSCRRAKDTGQRHFELGLSFSRVPARLPLVSRVLA